MGDLKEILFVAAMAVVLIAFRLEVRSKLYGGAEDLSPKERAKVLFQFAVVIAAIIIAGVLLVSALEG